VGAAGSLWLRNNEAESTPFLKKEMLKEQNKKLAL